jgi:hypothetical protein
MTYHRFLPINGVTYGVKSDIENIKLDENVVIRDVLLNLAGVDGEILWSKENNNYFISVVRRDRKDRIKFSRNPNTGYILLSGFYSSDIGECEGEYQAYICLGLATEIESVINLRKLNREKFQLIE